MATRAKTGKGTQFQIETVPGGGTYTLVGEVTKLSISGRKIDLPDATNMDSPVDGSTGMTFKEYVTGLADGGDVTVDGNFVPGDTGQQLFRTSFGTKTNFKISAADASWSWTFAGFNDQDNRDFPLDKPMTFSAKVKITGNDTFTVV